MANNNPFENLFKPLEAFKDLADKAPAFDAKGLIDASKQNLDALQKANQTIAEGAQSIFQRQVEIAQANAESALQLIKEVATSSDPKEGASKQANFAKDAFEKAASDASEINELATKTSNKAADIISKQVSQNIEKASKTAATTTKKKAA